MSELSLKYRFLRKAMRLIGFKKRMTGMAAKFPRGFTKRQKFCIATAEANPTKFPRVFSGTAAGLLCRG